MKVVKRIVISSILIWHTRRLLALLHLIRLIDGGGVFPSLLWEESSGPYIIILLTGGSCFFFHVSENFLTFSSLLVASSMGSDTPYEWPFRDFIIIFALLLKQRNPHSSRRACSILPAHWVVMTSCTSLILFISLHESAWSAKFFERSPYSAASVWHIYCLMTFTPIRSLCTLRVKLKTKQEED